VTTPSQSPDQSRTATPAGLSVGAYQAFELALRFGGIPKSPGGDSLSPEARPHPEHIEELLRFGLLREGVDDETMWVPVDPESVAAQVEKRARAAWVIASQLQEDWRDLTLTYRRARASRDPNSLVRYVEGKEAISQQLAVLTASATKVVITVQPGPVRPKEFLDASFPEDVALLRRGVQRRILYQTPARKHVHTRNYVRAVTEAGAEVRTMDDLYDRVFIIDDTVVYPFEGKLDVAAFNSEPSSVGFHMRLFEQHWLRASVFDGSSAKIEAEATGGEAPVLRGDQLTPQQRQIVKLAIEGGLTHEVIAKVIGCSGRTVGRQIENIRAIYGDAGNLWPLIKLGAEIRGEYPEGLPADW
jgi:DNA-binding CsgD family transcriptional regulator